MDPNEALRQIRQALKRWDELSGRGPEWTAERLAVAVQLADHAEALDEWLSRGGFLPDAWTTQTPRGIGQVWAEVAEHGLDAL